MIDVSTLLNYRLSVTVDNEIVLYSFSSPSDNRFNQIKLDAHVNQWYSTLSSYMNTIDAIETYHFDKQVRHQSAWCL
jgi:hypothetical protein